MENLKILFLDIDGVLNSARYDALRLPDQGNIDETRLPLLQRIIGETQAKIVLSSSWRTELNMVVVRGAIPGPKGGVVCIKNTVKNFKVKGAAAAISLNPQKASARINPQKASARNR